MNKQDLILYEFHNLDIYDLTDQQIIQIKNDLINNVKLNKLEEKIREVTLNLSQVGAPAFMSDAKYIALDNQKRLDLIFMLINNFALFKTATKNLKNNKNNCNNNDEYILNYLFKTKDLINTIWEYGEFKLEEAKENQKQVLLAQERVKTLQLEKLKYIENRNKEG